MSFLEMLDVVNEQLELEGKPPIAFDHDCREGICGACGMVINGVAHGPLMATTTCQLHMRHFQDGDTITVEPFRARAFPPIRDLVVDRGALDRIIVAGGYVSVATGNAVEANSIPVPKPASERAMDAARRVSAAAPASRRARTAAAMLFTAAKITHLGVLPQGQPNGDGACSAMVGRMDLEGFGGCTNYGECTMACPKEIGQENIAWMNKEFMRASLVERSSRLTGESAG